MIDWSEVPRIPTEVDINGMRLNGQALVELLSMVTEPNPRRWYRFEKHESGRVVVHVKMETDEQETSQEPQV